MRHCVTTIPAVLSICLCATGLAVGQTSWQPKKAPLMTRWAKDVSADKVHPEYPRPQMVRGEWQNLNGLWDYAIQPKDAPQPQKFDGQILVPFPVESSLSGVMQRVDENQRLWYRRTFAIPADWPGKRILLHFGAVDWETHVWVNRKEIGTHRGGYDPFTFDITDALHNTGQQEIVVSVWDPTDTGTQPRGKQVHKPEGIWYTPTTGIWQTVWLEPVHSLWAESLKLIPDLDGSRLLVQLDPAQLATNETLNVMVLDEDSTVAVAAGRESIEVSLDKPKLWSPDLPFLYHVRIKLQDGYNIADEVTCYFGMRKISLGKDEQGLTRLMLNNKPLFMFGPLDQGFWPDGLYTAPTDEALRYDIEMTRKLGFNLIRKHVKVEPDRWYYWCDSLGLLVWQDMPSGDGFPAEGQKEIRRSKESAEQHELEWKHIIDARRNHPCIVMWVPFNEAWGQYDTARIVEWTKKYDPTRLVDCASGWNDMQVGDVHDTHDYPGPSSPQPEPNRAAVLGEFGGLGLPLASHTWLAEKSWGYRSFKTSDDLTAAYLNLMNALRPLIAEPGLSAAVYTQTTDVEIEVNGLMTYDRAQVKLDENRIAEANRRLYLPPPIIKVIVPTSQTEPQTWRYTTDKPADVWFSPAFDDSAWAHGPAGFGRDGTPGIVARTPWTTADIWLRRSFDLSVVPADPQLRLYHDEDCEVYINGKLVATARGYTTSYVLTPLTDNAALKAGKNVIAIHCHQTGGGQGIDAGVVDVREHGKD